MLIERVIVNASPLITLFKSGQADLLPRLFTSIFVPDAVWYEVTATSHDDHAARGILDADWVKRLPPQPPDPEILSCDAGAGESEVLSYARQHPEVRAVIDDDYARKCEYRHGIRTLGTCGLLILAKRQSLIATVAPSLQALSDAGLWLSPGVIRSVLDEAGEE